MLRVNVGQTSCSFEMNWIEFNMLYLRGVSAARVAVTETTQAVYSTQNENLKFLMPDK